MSGGTFKGSYPISNGAYANDADKGMLTITNGEFIGSEKIFGMGQGGNGKGSVAISGGSFKAPTMGDSFAEITGGYAVSITGGSFTAEDVKNFVPKDSTVNAPIAKVVTNVDTYYYVVGAANIASAANNGSNVTIIKGGTITGINDNVTVTIAAGAGDVTINDTLIKNSRVNVTFTVPAQQPEQPEQPDPTPDRPTHTNRRYPAANTTTTPTETKKDDAISSAKTFDAGVALYVGMALTSVTGMAWVGKKRGL